MAVATETAMLKAGGGGNTTTAAAEGSFTKRPGGTPHRCLGGGCMMTVIGDCDCGGDNDGDSGR
jgi:hypothetical protein